MKPSSRKKVPRKISRAGKPSSRQRLPKSAPRRAIKHKKTVIRKTQISGRKARVTGSSASTLARKKSLGKIESSRSPGTSPGKGSGKNPHQRKPATGNRSAISSKSGKKGDSRQMSRGRGGKPLPSSKVGRGNPGSLEKLIRVGKITHYFDKIKVCVVNVDGAALFLGDAIVIKGKGTELKQKAASLQVESLEVKSVKKGQLVGLQVDRCVKEGDILYKIGPR